MSKIHPTAMVHPDARLGDGVTVGPYAVIEGPAVIGEQCVIQARAIVTGHVVMGCGNTIGYGAVIGADPQDNAFDPQTESHVVIGNHNRIREYATIHRGTARGSTTRVGHHCFLMAGTHLGHNVALADRVVIANNALLGGYVEVENDVFIGGGAVFHQFVKIGRNAIIQGLSAMSKHVPPFLIGCRHNQVAGINIVGLRRCGLEAAERKEIKDAFVLLYRSGFNTTQALAASKERRWGAFGKAFFEFVADAGRRGICSLAENSRQSIQRDEAD